MASQGNQEVKKTVVTLKSQDGKEFVVERKVAEESRVLKILIEDKDRYTDDAPIPLDKVTSDALESLLMFCEKHPKEPPSGEWELNEHRELLIQWDSKYMEEVKKNIELLCNLTNAAYHLEIKGLQDLTTQTVADMIRGKSVEEIRSIFGITNDLTPEEEREIRQQNLWAFKED